MASPARWSVAGAAATLLVACASLVGLEDPSPPRAAVEAGFETDSAGASTYDAADIADAEDAAPDVPSCPQKANDQPCEAGAECCSEACNQLHKCAVRCGNETVVCLLARDCCVGLYCSDFNCIPCLPAGQPVEKLGDVPIPDSCCSREYDSQSRCK